MWLDAALMPNLLIYFYRFPTGRHFSKRKKEKSANRKIKPAETSSASTFTHYVHMLLFIVPFELKILADSSSSHLPKDSWACFNKVYQNQNLSSDYFARLKQSSCNRRLIGSTITDSALIQS